MRVDQPPHLRRYRRQWCARVDRVQPHRAVQDAARGVDIGHRQFGADLAGGSEHAGGSAQGHHQCDIDRIAAVFHIVKHLTQACRGDDDAGSP
jgi:hypothetical protein